MICENNNDKHYIKKQIKNEPIKENNKEKTPSLLSVAIKSRSNSDDDYNNIIQKQKDEVQRILNNSDKMSVNESSFDPSKSSPPNDFMRRLQNSYHKYSIN